MNRKRRQKKSKAVSASELAQMGVCERLVVFEHRHGKRSTDIQREAIRRGLDEHEHFYRDGIRVADKKSPCYVATLVFGSGPETAALRLLRDRVLRPRTMGRWLIGAYYRTAPAMCVVVTRYQWLQPVVRSALWPAAWLADRLLGGNGGNHDDQ